MYRALLLITQLLLATVLSGQGLELFSSISGLESRRCEVLEIEDGYLVVAVAPSPTPYAATIYKVTHAGEVASSLALPPNSSDSVLYYLPRLVSGGGRYFILGISQLAAGSGASAAEMSASVRRFLMEVSSELVVLSDRRYQTLPIGTGYVYGSDIWTITDGLGVYLPGSVRVANGKVYSIEQLLLFEEGAAAPAGAAVFLEEFEVDGPGFGIAQIAGVGSFKSSAMADDGFYIFGSTGGTPLPGGGYLGGGPVGSYDLEGGFLGGFQYDGATSGEFGSGSVGRVRGDLIYTSYYGQFFTAPGCDGSAATIDVRHREGFTPAHPRFKVPDCGFYTTCREPFLFDRDGEGYHFVATDGQGTVALYRYDGGHNLLSRRLFQLPGHRVIGIHGATDGGVLLACIEIGPTGGLMRIMLYKIGSDGTVGSAALLSNALPFTVHPNPSADVVFVRGDLPQGVRVAVSDMQGRPLGTHTLGPDGSLSLEHLPAGAYVLAAAGPDGQLVGAQVVLRH